MPRKETNFTTNFTASTTTVLHLSVNTCLAKGSAIKLATTLVLPAADMFH